MPVFYNNPLNGLFQALIKPIMEYKQKQLSMPKMQNTTYMTNIFYFDSTGSYDGQADALHSALRRKRNLLQRLRVCFTEMILKSSLHIKSICLAF